jgi:tRNA(adenine34) deaminase
MVQEKYMQEALRLAREAGDDSEVPVGCVIVGPDGEIAGRGRNRREKHTDATAHAEIEAIREACAARGTWRLDGCSLYVTLEPCPMCAGAIIQARLSAVYYGVQDPVTGSCGSIINLFMENYGHEPKIVGGILEEDCRGVLQEFFKKLRG